METVSDQKPSEESPIKVELKECEEEFNQLCWRLGNSQYQASVHQGLAEELIVKMRNLNQKAAKLKEKEAKEAAAKHIEEDKEKRAEEAAYVNQDGAENVVQ